MGVNVSGTNYAGRVFELISQWGSIAAGDYGQAEKQLSSREGKIIVVSECGSTQ